jgi:hypothetical protein
MRIRASFGVAFLTAALVGAGSPSAAQAPFHLQEATVADLRSAFAAGRITCHALVDL